MTMKAIRHTFYTIAAKSPEFKREVADRVDAMGKRERFNYFRRFTSCRDAIDIMIRLASNNPPMTATMGEAARQSRRAERKEKTQ